ncbi:MAG: hypothetical protein R2695_19225 [Acidimicrobiales bacterium]
MGPMAGGFGGPGGANFNVGFDDIGDLLGGLFGRGRRGAAVGRSSRGRSGAPTSKPT